MRTSNLSFFSASAVVRQGWCSMSCWPAACHSTKTTCPPSLQRWATTPGCEHDRRPVCLLRTGSHQQHMTCHIGAHQPNCRRVPLRCPAHQVMAAQYEVPPWLSPDAVALLGAMLNPDPAARHVCRQLK